MKKILAMLVVLFLVPLTTSAQDFCEGNFDYDDDVDGTDAFTFKTDFGRSLLKNPCPPDGPAPVPKSGQTECYDESGATISCIGTGQNGEYQNGVEWPNPRFTDNNDGTITDNLTGLMWVKDANCIETNYPEFDNHETPGDGLVTWQNALDFVAGINDGTYSECGGNPAYNDWRLPNIKEWLSLIDYGQKFPALPSGHPFENVENRSYWSSTAHLTHLGNIICVHTSDGATNDVTKTSPHPVLPVRGGH